MTVPRFLLLVSCLSIFNDSCYFPIPQFSSIWNVYYLSRRFEHKMFFKQLFPFLYVIVLGQKIQIPECQTVGLKKEIQILKRQTVELRWENHILECQTIELNYEIQILECQTMGTANTVDALNREESNSIYAGVLHYKLCLCHELVCIKFQEVSVNVNECE